MSPARSLRATKRTLLTKAGDWGLNLDDAKLTLIELRCAMRQASKSEQTAVIMPMLLMVAASGVQHVEVRKACGAVAEWRSGGIELCAHEREDERLCICRFNYCRSIK